MKFSMENDEEFIDIEPKKQSINEILNFFRNKGVKAIKLFCTPSTFELF